MTFGLDSSGFHLKQLPDILSSVVTAQKNAFGTSFASDLADTVMGQLNGILGNELAQLWLLAQAVYQNDYANGAQGTSLDSLCELTGVVRLPATAGTVTLQLTGSNGTVVNTGFTAQNPTNGAQWVTTAGGTVSGGMLSLPAVCTVTGPVTSPSGTITRIITPVSGITAVTNSLDALPGTNVETDAALRGRRNLLLTAAGKSTVEAIRSAVLNVAGVAQTLVLNNPSNVTDVDGHPPHSFEVLVIGGTTSDLLKAIFDAAPAGIEIDGTTTGTVTDSQGFSQPSAFTRPSAVNIYISANLTTNPTTYPGNTSAAQTIAATLEAGVPIGAKVIYNQIFGQFYAIPGVIEVNTLMIGTTPSPTGTTDIVLTDHQIAAFDSSRIVITP